MLKNQVKQRIEELGWSIATTAKRTGIHRDIISRIVHGKINDPRLSTLIKLSNGLGKSIDQLAGIQKYES